MTSTHEVDELWKRLFNAGISDIQRGMVMLSMFFVLKELNAHAQEGDWAESMFSNPEHEAFRWETIKVLAESSGMQCRTFLMEKVSKWLQLLAPGSCLDQADFALAQTGLPEKLYGLLNCLDGCCQAYPSLELAYEAVLDWAACNGLFAPLAGQVMTPPHIARRMVELAGLTPSERVADVSCGTANLLVAAKQALEEQGEGTVPACSLYGMDFDPAMETIAWTRLFLSGIHHPHISNRDALGSTFHQLLQKGQLEHIHVLLGNPPYGGGIDERELDESLKSVDTNATELLFLAVSMQLLREGGRAVLLLPDGVLRNTPGATKALRKQLLDENQLHAVVSLPQGIFQPFANIASSLVIFTRGGQTHGDILFYRVFADGYALDAKRREDPDHDDLHDLCVQYAAHRGWERPSLIRESLSEDLWEQFVQGLAQAHYVAPVTDICDGRKRVTSFRIETAQQQRAWLVSAQEIRAHGYQLDRKIYIEEGQTTSRPSPRKQEGRRR